MNILFYLSPPVDLSPFYSLPVPLELFELVKERNSEEKGKPIELTSFFSQIYNNFREFFPDMSYLVIDGCLQPVFFQFFKNIPTLHIPSTNLFAKLLVYAGYVMANELEPLTLFYPANCWITPFESFASALRELFSRRISLQALTFFASSIDSRHQRYILPGDMVFKLSSSSLYSIQEFLSPLQVQQREYDKDVVLGSTDVFLFHVTRFLEYLSAYEPDLEELLFLMVDAWQDSNSIQAVLPDILKKLDAYSIEKMFATINDLFVCKIEGKYAYLRMFSDLLNYLSVDENRNYIEGKVYTEQTINSILINRGNQTLTVENCNGITLLANQNEVRVRGAEVT